VSDKAPVVVLAGIIGAMIGSFLNVCIYRWPNDESVVRPRSRCGGCQETIAWYDNIPIVSWLLLRGRCRRCGTAISIQYPLVELATAIIWAAMAAFVEPEWAAFRAAVFFTILLGIAMTDARQYIIPDEFSLGGLVIGLLFSLPDGFHVVERALIGAVVGFGVLWAVGAAGTRIFKEDAMGGGDIKMMAMVGAFLGWDGVLLTIFLGALLGTIIFVPLSLLGKKRLVPFGVFLAVGAAATFVVGQPIIAWYRSYLAHP
jgi:leader peptidase (prepilin peptidase) / N-methyltransferase